MNRPKPNLRGGALLWVVVCMALSMAGVAVLATYSVRAWERGKVERLRILARALADSAVAYVRHGCPGESAETDCAESLSASDLLPPGLSGTIRLAPEGSAHANVWRFHVEVAQGERRVRMSGVAQRGIAVSQAGQTPRARCDPPPASIYSTLSPR